MSSSVCFWCYIHLNKTAQACALRNESNVEWQPVTCNRWESNPIWCESTDVPSLMMSASLGGFWRQERMDAGREKEQAALKLPIRVVWVCVCVCRCNMISLQHHQYLLYIYSILLYPSDSNFSPYHPDFCRREEYDDSFS